MQDKKLKFHYQFDDLDGESKREFGIVKMSRKQKELCDLFFSSTVSKYIKAGILPRAAYKVTLENSGGTISDSEKQENVDYRTQLFDLSLDLGDKQIKPEADRSSEEQKQIEELRGEMKIIQEKIISFESEQFMIYENTAEAKARNRTIIWLLLNLSYEKIGEKYENIFKGKDLEEKLDEYDDLEDNKFLIKVLSRIHYLLMLWFLGRIESDEDFVEFDKDATKSVELESIEEAPLKEKEAD